MRFTESRVNVLTLSISLSVLLLSGCLPNSQSESSADNTSRQTTTVFRANEIVGFVGAQADFKVVVSIHEFLNIDTGRRIHRIVLEGQQPGGIPYLRGTVSFESLPRFLAAVDTMAVMRRQTKLSGEWDVLCTIPDGVTLRRRGKDNPVKLRLEDIGSDYIAVIEDIEKLRSLLDQANLKISAIEDM